MIHDVDESLRTLLRRDALNGSAVDVVLDAPTKDWAARRNAPTLDLYLYDIREAVGQRQMGDMALRDGDGHVTGRRPYPRRFKLSYLVTAWTQRPEDEHRLLAAVLACFLQYDCLPGDVLAGSLAGAEAVQVTIAIPPPQDRAISDVWSALGGELKPSLDLVVIAPFEAGVLVPAAKLVLEEPRLRFRAGDGDTEEPRRGNGAAATERAGAEAAAATAAGPSERVAAGTEERPGRVFTIRTIDR